MPDRPHPAAAPSSSPATAPLRAAVVLLAAGEGRRTGQASNKVLLPLAGRRVLTWSIRWAQLLPETVRTVVVVRDGEHDLVDAACRREVAGPVELVTGGDSRHASEWAALRLLRPAIEDGQIDVVVIHDAARPLAGSDVWADVIAAAEEHGGALPASDHASLASRDDAEPLVERIVAVQTPQAFRAAPLLEAYARAADDGFVGTDTASCMERYTSLPVHCVPGPATNIKITFPEDLFLAERLLEKAGYDLSGGREPHRQRERVLPRGPRQRDGLPGRLRQLWPHHERPAAGSDPAPPPRSTT